MKKESITPLFANQDKTNQGKKKWGKRPKIDDRKEESKEIKMRGDQYMECTS